MADNTVEHHDFETLQPQINTTEALILNTHANPAVVGDLKLTNPDNKR
jgi:hypothetical protein